MNSSASPPIERATAFLLSTFHKNEVSRLLLETGGAQCRIETVHDCFSVLEKRDAPDDATVKDLQTLASRPSMFSGQERLGLTTVLVVQLAAGADEAELAAIATVILGRSPSMDLTAGEFAVWSEDEQIVMFCESRNADRLIARIYGEVRLLETLRHKLLGQFQKYEAEYREAALQAAAKLRNHLEQLEAARRTESRPVSTRARCAAMVTQSQRITEAYSRALIAQGPVRQIQAMLDANLHNIERILRGTDGTHASEVAAALVLLPQRYESLSMVRGQLQADLGLAQPVLDAAECVAQSCHGQLLGELAVTEAMESRQRDFEGQSRERQNLRLTMLGIWLGMNQVWTGCLALIPEESRPDKLSMLLLILVPTGLCSVWGLVSLFRNGVQISNAPELES